MQMSMFSLEEHPANHFLSQACENDLMTRVATSCLPTLQLLTSIAPSTSFGKMFRGCCRVTEERILEPSSLGWGNSGLGSPTGFLTLNTAEHMSMLEPSRNVEGVCSLSDVLETGDVPQRYFLTPKACAGILRRAEKRGKTLPIQLHHALQAVAGALTEQETPEGKML